MNAPLSASSALSPTPVPSLLDVFGGKPGMRGDISNEMYHADRSCISTSAIKQILRSPAHYRAYMNGPREETTAMFLGTAIHARLLEPAVFASEYVTAPTTDRRTKEYKEFEVANAAKKVLTADQMAMVEAIEHNARLHDSFFQLLQAGLPEQTIIYQDEETGIWIKVRPDMLCMDFGDGVCLDVKSTEDASAEQFARTCVNYDYDVQVATYLTGLRKVFGRDFDFCFAAVEKKAPHSVAVYGAPPEMIERGERRMRHGLCSLKRCRDSGEWPSYQPHGVIEVLDWPRWAW